jgi:hypothetical protein
MNRKCTDSENSADEGQPFQADVRLESLTYDPVNSAVPRKFSPLPVIESCNGCGACCLVVTQPPFYRIFDEHGEDAWERLKSECPDLVAALLADNQTRRAAGEPLYGTPCVWLDPTSLRCRHYEFRPLACRQFEIGSLDCHDARRRARIRI